MTTLKEDYKARASEFINNEDWKEYIDDKTSVYDDFEDQDMAKMKGIVERNCYLIKYFADDLAEKSTLSEKTIQKHVDNVDFYLNYYAVDYLTSTAEEAMHEGTLDDFMVNWFPRKAMWCSKTAIKETCASLAKFYKWMNENDLISDKELADFREVIKDNKEEWIERYQQYERMMMEDDEDYFSWM